MEVVQMKIRPGSTTSELRQALEDEFSGSCPPAIVLVMGESDGDYFLQICKEEGGGIDPEVEAFFKGRPIGKRLSFGDLLEVIKSVQLVPRFISLDGSVVINYVLHIWIAGFYISHDPVESRTVTRKMSITDRLFHPVRAI